MAMALRTFMVSLVDYAGLFPPASLAPPAAVAEYATHLSEPEAWMLGRFIAPAGQLSDIGELARPHWQGEQKWHFSALVGARESGAATLAALAGQAKQIEAFENDHAGRAVVDSLELPIPVDGAQNANEFIPNLLARLGESGLLRPEVYLEILPKSDTKMVLAAIAAAAADLPGTRLGAKLRCGGVTPDAFPTVETVAATIHACAGLELPLKCTAGLHHPVRHQSHQPEVMMHGFLNVFGCGLLAWSGRADYETLVACVAETDAEAFSFTDNEFAWRDHQVTAAEIEQIRGRFLSGFGSCSFIEPRSDLQSLGIL